MKQETIAAATETGRAYDLVLDFLKGEIAAGRLQLGDKLPSERAMMVQLALSRNSVREALRQLENMGFVHSVHGQGSFLVNQAGAGFSALFSMLLLLQQTDRQEFWALRHSMERAAFAAAVAAPNPAQLAVMEQAVQDMAAAADMQQLEQAEAIFHRALVACSGNRLFQMILDALSELDKTYRHETLTGIRDSVRAPLYDTHRRILQALRAGDSRQGLAALEEHFRLIA